MCKAISLVELYASLQAEMISKAEFSKVLSHPTDQGDNTETSWITWFNKYLPNRYQTAKASIIDAQGHISDQIDAVIYDAQYSYLAFNQNDILYLPAESVYAVFEVKQTLNKRFMEYAGKKASSVRRLHRTSTSIPYAGGVYKPKQPNRIISGILTTDCEWKEGFGQPFQKCIKQYLAEEQIDCGCVLKGGAFFFDYSEQILKTSKPEEGLVFFFLQLLIKLQQMGTVSAIDLNEYMSVLSIMEANL